MWLFGGKGQKKGKIGGNSEKHIDKELYNDLFQVITKKLIEMKLIERPELTPLPDDMGIVAGIFDGCAKNPELLRIKDELSREDFLYVCGMQAIKTGLYTALCQKKTGKSVSDFSRSEIKMIIMETQAKASEELGIKDGGLFDDYSKATGTIIDSGFTIMRTKGDRLCSDINRRTFMQVLFDAGVTIVKPVI